ncbi:hypothetical protein GWK47_008017 [Chionoecetes opilio]|uniref:Uncharacterized protein n=1 Tax=Chionoecetes opilio TaxID=41210 RepID=A0A8J5CQT9_CHIOP|nr:hypothetical protein GWK47_008017 [Chionoecetes opilio]
MLNSPRVCDHRKISSQDLRSKLDEAKRNASGPIDALDPQETRVSCGAALDELLRQAGAAARAAGRPRGVCETLNVGWKNKRLAKEKEEEGMEAAAATTTGVVMAVSGVMMMVLVVVAVVLVVATAAAATAAAATDRAVSGFIKPRGHITTCQVEGVAEGQHHP